MRNLFLACLTLSLVAGCAGRDEMRSVASQSSAILNQAQTDAAAYTKAQRDLDATILANISSFNAMSASGNQTLKTSQIISVDQTTRGFFAEFKSSDPDTSLRSLDLLTAPPEEPGSFTIDTSKTRQAIAQLNELAKEQDLQSQVAFLVQFAVGVQEAYQEAQKKATEMATKTKAESSALAAGAQ